MKALITGASSGIGKDMAKILNQKGYNLVLVARDIEKLEQTKKELEKSVQNEPTIENNKIEKAYKKSKKATNKIEIIQMDLSEEQNCIELANKVKDIDILINNAGFGDCGRFSETDLNKDISMIKTNVIAYHILTKLYLKEMKKKNSGKILNVASIAGFMPGPLMATYYATKNYIVRLSEAIREELKKEKSKVQISILCPGPVETNFNKVANVKFSLREANSMQVAKYAIKKLEKGKFYIVPGIDVKLARFGAKIAPSNFVAKITYKVQKRKIQGSA
ncbi:MAG: SDR family oxidoreductase [Clostridiales bacterium]|nr:SDR family oxidoreductase [Clostridiales bacterium]MBD9159639.1 SDR family oxidoreductase [Clostridiales bacterium]